MWVEGDGWWCSWPLVLCYYGHQVERELSVLIGLIFDLEESLRLYRIDYLFRLSFQ